MGGGDDILAILLSLANSAHEPVAGKDAASAGGDESVEMRVWPSSIHWTTKVSFLPCGFPPLSIPSLPQMSAAGWKASGQAGAGETQISGSQSCREKHLHRCGCVGGGVLRAGKGQQASTSGQPH